LKHDSTDFLTSISEKIGAHADFFVQSSDPEIRGIPESNSFMMGLFWGGSGFFMGVLEFLEQTSLATFIRESESYLAFPTFLFLHTLGLSLVVGANTLVAIRVLGLASNIPLQPLRRLFPFMWIGFILTVLSGLGLGIAAATTRLVNPILLSKLVLVVISGVLMRRLEKNVFVQPDFKESEPGTSKIMAATLLVLWVAITTMGRLIAYSATIFGT
jgi:hypothetical protein